MTIIPSSSLKCNPQLEINDQAGTLSNDGGLPLIKEFMVRSNFERLLKEQLSVDKRPHVQHSYYDLTLQVLLQLIAGYSQDAVSNHLKDNQLFRSLLGKPLASQPTLSRFLNASGEALTEGLRQTNLHLIAQYYKTRAIKTLVIDIDTTHYDTYGHQERADYNSHYGTLGYQPLLAYDAGTGLCLKSELRNGSTYSSNAIDEFLTPLFDELKVMGFETLLVRGDSGFASPKLYECCEKAGVYYVIRLKNNAILKELGSAYQVLSAFEDVTQTVEHVDALEYKAKSWTRPRTVIGMQKRKAGELFFSESMYIVTNMETQAMTLKTIVEIYRKRGNMENYIKESKLGYFMDKTDSSSFSANALRMTLSMLAYNLMTLLKLCVLPNSLKNCTISTLRVRLIKIAVKVVHHSRQLCVKMDSTFVYLSDYFESFERLFQFSF